ncbi:uncharacterized protein LOC128397045 [Panonychus citri]|uniref:uncharacterized protein LOC128397045 n=1 Tax=Panonychus citri TaxID=50023 RepID=UPI002307132E|nr:uncharacterized protein LOC128397045 [Panonychus citri]
MLRMVCYSVMNKDRKQIGGPGKIVEIDETMVYKRKYNVGRLSSDQSEQVWVFGGIERESKTGFAEIVESRDQLTLFNVIDKYIRPGTTVYSDGWKCYQNLNKYDYNHDWVNHSKNFVNPKNPNVHTQNIERNGGQRTLPTSSNDLIETI